MDPSITQRSPPPSHGGKKIIQALTMAILIIIFMGYIFIWIMEPTNLYYKTWTPKIKAKTNSTYFGTTGDKILMNTFPALFFAVLGCVYLQLAKITGDSNGNGIIDLKRWLAKGRKHLIIKGLGIVSTVELAFFIMFIALLVWSLSKYLHTSFDEITSASAAYMGMKVWELKLDYAALFLGIVGNIVLSFLFYPVSRGSSVLPIFGLTSEGSIKYHIWLGHIVMTFFTAHGVCYIVFWAKTHQISQMYKWAKTGVSNVAGEISLLAGLVMWATTFTRIRRKMFEVFFYTHHLYIVFVVFFVLHVGISYLYIMLPSFYLFMIDRYLRFLQSRQSVRLVSARVLPCETVELNFAKSKGLTYNPTSTIFINIPSISILQWHPFTIISSSHLEPQKLSVMIKSKGFWSKQLYEMLASPSSIERLDVSVEGPYGPVSTDFLRHDLLVMVSGGSGITPFISIIRDLMHRTTTLNSKTPKIILVTSFQTSLDLTMLNLILPISCPPSQFSSLDLKIQAYVTRQKQPPPPPPPSPHEHNTKIRTILFKPKPSDAPITPVLGQNNWIWLGTIISTSFIIFLLSIGFLTRYYIYPKDHNTNKIYSSSKKAVLYMLFICIGIVISATAIFLWNKRENGRENKQVLSINNGEDIELESLPNQSLAQCVDVHYGERPNFKRILMELNESSVGVLVCGPKKMSHEIAKICSSCSATNLHYESISFSW